MFRSTTPADCSLSAISDWPTHAACHPGYFGIMLVYGDRLQPIRLTELVNRMALCLAGVEAAPSLDALRALLVRAGQLEQAVFDAEESRGDRAGGCASAAPLLGAA